MDIKIRQYSEADTEAAVRIWNHIVEEGVAFPQIELLTAETGKQFFSEQSFTGIAYDGGGGEIVGLYILHPNNVGRCGHICNASYAVKSELRGHRIGEALVKHCMEQGKKLGFRLMIYWISSIKSVLNAGTSESYAEKRDEGAEFDLLFL